MKVWPIFLLACAFVLSGLSEPVRFETFETPASGSYVPIWFENGTGIIVFEGNPPNETFSIHTFAVYDVINKGVEFSTIQNETLNLTSDRVNLTIRCQRPYVDGKGCNVVGVGLDGVPGFLREIWAYPVINYTLGLGGNESTIGCAEGPPYRPDNETCPTVLGDGSSMLVLGFGTSHSPDEFARLTVEVIEEFPSGQMTFRATTTNRSRVFFRWDFDQDLITDTPWRYSLTMTDVFTWHYDSGPPQYVCAQAWDGIGIDEAGQLAEVGCADLKTLNHPPQILNVTMDPPLSVPEGKPISVDVEFIDVDPYDTHTAYMDFSLGPNYSVPVEEQNLGNHVAGRFSTNHTYGDNGNFAVIVGVMDDNGALATKEIALEVLNVNPYVTLEVYNQERVDVKLRIAGEKWHDVEMRILEEDIVLFASSIVRHPGCPDDQTISLEGFLVNRSRTYAAEVVYTPEDDPANGQIWGSTPAWLLFYSGGREVAIVHHTFNARHKETWFWKVENLSSFLPAEARFTLYLNVSDPGSDDLSIRLNFSFGLVIDTVVLNGPTPDAYPSPEVSPMVYHWVSELTLPTPCILFVEVLDDDGGLTELTYYF